MNQKYYCTGSTVESTIDSMKLKRHGQIRQMVYGDLIDALVTILRTEPGGNQMIAWMSEASNFEEQLTALSQVIQRTDNPVIVMLAKKAGQIR